MANRYWVGGTGTWDNSSTANWSATSGGAAGASAPTTADAVIIDSLSGSGTITTGTGATSSTTSFNNANITLTLGGNYTCVSSFTFTQGAINLATFVFTCLSFASTNSNTRSINFGASGSMTLTGNNTTIWNVGTATGWTVSGTPVVNCTYSGATGTRTITNTVNITEANQVSFNVTAGTDIVVATSGFKSLNFTGFAGTFNNGGRTLYGNLTLSSGMTLVAGTSVTTFGATSGAQQITTAGKTLDFPLTFNGIGGTFAFQDALTQGSTRAFTITNGTVQLKNGVTSTVGAFATSGTNQKALQSTTSGSPATLSQASGTVTASRLTIRDINATGGATWNALYESGNVDAGGNTGWNFGGSPQVVAEVPYHMRSFTIRRSF